MPGQYHIYIPWDDTGFETEAKRWQEIYTNALRINEIGTQMKAAGQAISPKVQATLDDQTSLDPRKKPTLSIHGKDLSAVQQMDVGDTVYVFGHCASGVKTIENNAGDTLDPEQLADRMLQDGIHNDAKYLKLWCCEGGDGNESFAQLFYQETRKKRFMNAEVTGYRKTLKNATPGGHKTAVTGWTLTLRWGSPFVETHARASSVAVHFPPR